MGESAVLMWDPNPEPDIAGYRLHFGTSSGSYTETVDVGNTTTATVSNLDAGTTYFLVVTAYNTTALESLPSNEVSYAPLNQPPTVSLTSPLSGTSLTAPATIALSASASDSDGSINRVEYYTGATKLGEATVSPYGFTWSPVFAGTYNLTARAFDNQGTSMTSAATTVTVTAPPSNQPPAVSLTSPLSGTSLPAPATVALSASATDSDGSITRVEYYTGATKLGEATVSPYSFTWSPVFAGTYTLTARAFDNQGASTTSAATTVTVTAPPSNQPPAVSLTSPLSGTSLPAPATIALSASASDSDGSINRVEYYTGATKLGEATVSPYSFTWSPVAAGTYTLTARAFDNQGASTTSAATTVTVTAPLNQPPTVSLTSPLSGTSLTAPATIALSASASDSDGSINRVEYYTGATKLGEATVSPYSFTWSPVAAGTYTLTARAFDNQGASTTSAATIVAVTSSQNNQAPAVSLTSPLTGTNLTAPAAVALSASATDSDGSITRVEYYMGAAKLGEATVSPYSFTWSPVAAGTYNLTARAFDNQGASTTSAATTLTVTASSNNQPPVVSLTSPLSGTSLPAPATVTLSASATDSDGSITRVEYYMGAAKLGEATASPYSFTWSPVAAGTYNLTARAFDNQGASTTSAATTLTVTASSNNQPPAVSLTRNFSEKAFSAPATVALGASASDSDGFITRVEFYQGATKLGEATASPYHFNWNSVSAGTYSVTARAFDNQGASTTSSARSLTVTGPAINQPPAVSLTSPLSGTDLNAPAAISMSATANDSDGSISRVEFYTGDTKLGEFTASPYSFIWSPVATGTYSLTARAFDNQGAFTTSDAATVTVTMPTDNQRPAVSLTSPVAGTKLTAPADIVFSAAASDIDGSISRVEFYNGPTKVGEATASPYSSTWNAVPAGTYTLAARAFDNRGASTTSLPLVLTVTGPSVNQPPVVSLTSPLEGTSFAAPVTVSVTAAATDTDGSISRVEFYTGATKLGEATASPYSFTWNPVATGTYDLTARAFDNQGASTESASVSVSVNTPLGENQHGISDVVALPDGTVQFTVTGVAGRSISVYASVDLKDWTLLNTASNPTGTLVMTDAEAANSERRFYRTLLDGSASDPVGFVKLQLAGATSIQPLALSYLGICLANPVSYQGTIAAWGFGSVKDASASWSENQFNGLNGDFYMEIISGPHAGLTADIVATDVMEKALVIDEDLSSLLAGGELYRIRRHRSIRDVFGADNEAGLSSGATATSSDQIRIFNPVTQKFLSYYFQAGGPGGTGWRSTTDAFTDVSGIRLYLDQGVICRRKSAGDLTLTVTGAAKISPGLVPIGKNSNLVANMFPAGSLTLGNSGLYVGNPSLGLAGASTLSSADEVQIWNGAAMRRYFHKDGGSGGTGWRRSSDLATDASDTQIPAGSSIMVVRKKGRPAFNWTVLPPF